MTRHLRWLPLQNFSQARLELACQPATGKARTEAQFQIQTLRTDLTELELDVQGSGAAGAALRH